MFLPPHVPKDTQNLTDNESETGSVSVTVVEAEVHNRGPPPDPNIHTPPQKEGIAEHTVQPQPHTNSNPQQFTGAGGDEQQTEDQNGDKVEKTSPEDVPPPLGAAVPAENAPSYVNVDSRQRASGTIVTPCEYMEPCRSVSALPQMDGGAGTEATAAAGDGSSKQDVTTTLTESEKRLSALKSAWGSQDKEDVSYLQVVL